MKLIPHAAVVETGVASILLDAATRVLAGASALHDLVALFVEDVQADGGPSLDFADARIERADPAIPTIVVELGDEGLDAVAAAHGVRARVGGPVDERHGVQVTPAGVRVWGPTPEAVHRGLTTLRQLIAQGVGVSGIRLPVVRIVDGPRFAWRGLSLDVARTFHDIETVERVIDMCALYKLSVLHLHLTDDQGWRLEVPGRPALTEVGARGAMAGRPGGWYSQADLAHLIAYAARRFVTIVPEVDLPGHAAAVFRSYPELAPTSSADRPHDTASVAAGALDPEDPAVWTFVDDVLDAVTAQFPDTACLHIGGDEPFGMAPEAHAAFVARMREHVRARGRVPVGWQETARAGLDAGSVAQYWIDFDEKDAETVRAFAPPVFADMLIAAVAAAKTDLPRALESGAQVIVSPSARLYFDRPHADASTDPEQELIRRRLGMPVYPPTGIRDGVEWDVLAVVPGSVSDEQIAGVEAAVWCETVGDRRDLELLLLPRLPGAAEKAWASAMPTDWTEYRGRLAGQAALWAHRGWDWFRADSVDWQA